MAAQTKPELPILEFPHQAAWEAWLERHHGEPGVWLRFAKKGSGASTLSYLQAVESSLCFGWIDGQAAPEDERYYRQRFTPRRPGSKWSEINRGRATKLIEQGRMRPSGLEQVAAAKADGRWENAYAPSSRAPIPEDLQRALDAEPAAAAFFATLGATKRYSFLYRLHSVKRPESRARRIADYIERLRAGRTLED